MKKTINQFFFFPKRTCAHHELKETKNITDFLLLKTHPICVIVVISIVFHYEQMCRTPTSANDEIFF